MNCFQHIPESRGAIAQPPRGGATKKKADPTTQHALIGFKHPHLPQPSALHNRTCPCPLTSDRTRNARAPTSPRSIGFCAIWDCISSSSSSPCTDEGSDGEGSPEGCRVHRIQVAGAQGAQGRHQGAGAQGEHPARGRHRVQGSGAQGAQGRHRGSGAQGNISFNSSVHLIDV